MGTVQVETGKGGGGGGGGGGGHNPVPGGNMLRGQFRTGSVPDGLSSHSATRTTNSPAGLAMRSFCGLGFRIALWW